MSERITTAEVVKSKKGARLQLREFDGVFTFLKPLASGDLDTMRGDARWLCWQHKGTVYGEIDLEKLEELRVEARKRHPRV